MHATTRLLLTTHRRGRRTAAGTAPTPRPQHRTIAAPHGDALGRFAGARELPCAEARAGGAETQPTRAATPPTSASHRVIATTNATPSVSASARHPGACVAPLGGAVCWSPRAAAAWCRPSPSPSLLSSPSPSFAALAPPRAPGGQHPALRTTPWRPALRTSRLTRAPRSRPKTTWRHARPPVGRRRLTQPRSPWRTCTATHASNAVRR